MTDAKNSDTTRVDDLNSALLGVENHLMRRAIDRDRAELDRTYDFINKAAEAGLIDIECDGCGEELDEPSEDSGEE